MGKSSKKTTEVVYANTKIPYSIIREEAGSRATDLFREFKELTDLYGDYKEGAKFAPEGSAGDYLPSTMRSKIGASLVNKQARFLFSETPDFNVKPKGNEDEIGEEAKEAIKNMQVLINEVFSETMLGDKLLKAARDAGIAKRVGCMLNFNEEDGVSVSFFNALHFLFETNETNPDILEKFVGITVVKESNTSSERRLFKKKYEMINGVCWFEDIMYDGAGRVIEVINEFQETLFNYIPAVVILNGGLTGDLDGESDLQEMMNHESTFSKISNADIDSERKGMNPIKYTIDMTSESTSNLKTGAGAYWDLQSNQDINDDNAGRVGVIAPTLQHTEAVDSTLKRIKTEMFEMMDVPLISIETMSGVITSGKALKAIYWPLTVRCKEIMKSWEPQLQKIVKMIIDGAMLYPNTVKEYLSDAIVPAQYKVEIDVNYPIPEDEEEERNADRSDVDAMCLSRRTYLMRWKQLTEKQAETELEQIALERELLEESFTGMM